MEPGRGPTRFHLVRHGRVADEWTERIYGCLDVPLSEEGRRQAERAARRLRDRPLDAVVSSGLARAEYGAARVREGRDLPRRDVPALREMERGEWAGMRFDELEIAEPGAFAAWLADPARKRPPGGENLADLADRVVPALEELAAKHAGGEVAVVAHSWVIRGLACRALRLDPEACLRFDLRPGAIVTLDWPPRRAAGRAVLVGWSMDEVPERRTGWARGPFRS